MLPSFKFKFLLNLSLSAGLVFKKDPFAWNLHERGLLKSWHWGGVKTSLEQTTRSQLKKSHSSSAALTFCLSFLNMSFSRRPAFDREPHPVLLPEETFNLWLPPSLWLWLRLAHTFVRCYLWVLYSWVAACLQHLLVLEKWSQTSCHGEEWEKERAKRASKEPNSETLEEKDTIKEWKWRRVPDDEAKKMWLCWSS